MCVSTPSSHQNSSSTFISLCKWTVYDILKSMLTNTCHLGHVQMVAIKAVTGIAFLYPYTASIFTSIQNATFFCLQLLKAVYQSWRGGESIETTAFTRYKNKTFQAQDDTSLSYSHTNDLLCLLWVV